MSPANVFLLIVAVGQAGSGSSNTDEKSVQQLRLEHMRATTVGYKFLLGTEPQTKLELREQPVLRWNDPVIGVVDGVLFVVTNRRRPAAILSVWMRSSGTITHNQYQLLTDKLLVAVRNKETVWRPAVSRIVWKSVTPAPTPAKTRSQRLVQMRAIARQFSGHVHEKRADAGRFTLRLMTSPLYRYEDAESGVIDGAMFALVKGTNPEVTLLLETVDDANGLHWKYLLSPLTNRKTELQYRGNPIWTYRPRHHPTEPFYDIVIRHDAVGGDVKTREAANG